MIDEQHLPAGALGDALVLTAGDQRLSAADTVEDKFLPPRIELGEHVVEQQDRILAGLFQKNLAFGQFEGERRRPCLTL